MIMNAIFRGFTKSQLIYSHFNLYSYALIYVVSSNMANTKNEMKSHWNHKRMSKKSEFESQKND